MTEQSSTGAGAGTARSGRRDVTLSDIATAAGVSVSTASRVFTRPDLVSAATVQRVSAIAARLGYVGNLAARALVTGRFRNIAMVVPDIANPFFPPLVRAVQNHAVQRGYAVFLGDSDEHADRERMLLSRLGGQVEGFVLAGTRLDETAIGEVALTRPTVLINRDIASVPRVLIDSGQGVRAAVAHLHRLGHRHLAYLGGPRDSWSDQERRQGARSASDGLGCSLDVLELGRPTFAGGREAVDPVLETAATAAIAFDDVVAHGLLAGLRARGLHVPHDFSIIGCDDTLAIGTDPALSTIGHRADEAGFAAVDLLLAAAADRTAPPQRVTIGTRLIHRQTTAAPPRS